MISLSTWKVRDCIRFRPPVRRAKAGKSRHYHKAVFVTHLSGNGFGIGGFFN